MKIELSDQVLQYIIQVLGERPYRESAPVIDELARKIHEEQSAGAQS